MRHAPFQCSILMLALGLCSRQPDSGTSAETGSALACIEPNVIQALFRFLSDDLNNEVARVR